MQGMDSGSSITDILLRRGAISQDKLEKARQDAGHIRIEKYLDQNQVVSPTEITLAVSEYLNVPPVVLTHYTPNAELLERLPVELCIRHSILPMMLVGQTLYVAMGDPFNILALEDFRAATGYTVIPMVVHEREVNDILGKLSSSAQGRDLENMMRGSEQDVEVDHAKSSDESETLEQTLENVERAPVIRMVNMILIEALRSKASDIHIEPMEKTTRLRYRVDGMLLEKPSPPKSFHGSVVSRIKIMAELDIAERRMPQDGRIKVRALGKEVDVRVSILPTVHGEKVVMRMLDKANLAAGLSMLGLDDFAREAMQYAIDQPHGIILVTGPTGSGKTTTLYSCLQDLNKPDVNIVTCEDPVEYELPGINQVHVNVGVGLTFASVLRSVLRQDPDIILVGEIRDAETADVAVKAALTGHLVLSTLHTNDAAGAVVRMVDMGVEPFLLSSCLILTQAQRLYRKLCTFCRTPVAIDADILRINRIDPEFFKNSVIYKAVGCPKCNNIGYKGRGALMEVLTVNAIIRDAILLGKGMNEIREMAIRNGMVTMKEAGLRKVRDGVTALEAALEVTGGE